MEICNPLDIPVGPILSMKEIAEDPGLRETGTVVEVDHPVRGKYLTVGNPIKLSDIFATNNCASDFTWYGSTGSSITMLATEAYNLSLIHI